MTLNEILSSKVFIGILSVIVIWLIVLTINLFTQSKKTSDNTISLAKKLEGVCIGNTCVEDENVLKMINGTIPTNYTRGPAGRHTVRIGGNVRNVKDMIPSGYDTKNICKATKEKGYDDAESYPFRTMNYDNEEDDSPEIGFGGGIFDMYIKPGIAPLDIVDCPPKPV